jgi:hypothetical protein
MRPLPSGPNGPGIATRAEALRKVLCSRGAPPRPWIACAIGPDERRVSGRPYNLPAGSGAAPLRTLRPKRRARSLSSSCRTLTAATAAPRAHTPVLPPHAPSVSPPRGILQGPLRPSRPPERWCCGLPTATLSTAGFSSARPPCPWCRSRHPPLPTSPALLPYPHEGNNLMEKGSRGHYAALPVQSVRATSAAAAISPSSSRSAV